LDVSRAFLEIWRFYYYYYYYYYYYCRYRGSFPAVKRPGCEADYSPPSSAEVKNVCGAIPPLPNTPSWRGAQLKHRDYFTSVVVVVVVVVVVANFMIRLVETSGCMISNKLSQVESLSH
jgi:hypothetical protein